MAVNKKGSSKAETSGKGETKEKSEYKYGKSSLNFWNTNTMLKLNFRKNTFDGRSTAELVLTIYPLDEDRKFIKNEDDKYVSYYFNMNFNDLVKFVYGVRRTIYPTKKENFAGAICSHISSETNNGSQLEFIISDEGYSVNILYIEEGEIVDSIEHILANDQSVRYYDEEGEPDEKTINIDVIGFLQALEASLPLVGGMGASLVECWGGSSSSGSGKYSGTLNAKRKVGGNSLKERVANLNDDDDDETDEAESEEVEEAPKKTTIKKKATNAKSMKAILDEEDDD